MGTSNSIPANSVTRSYFGSKANKCSTTFNIGLSRKGASVRSKDVISLTYSTPTRDNPYARQPVQILEFYFWLHLYGVSRIRVCLARGWSTLQSRFTTLYVALFAEISWSIHGCCSEKRTRYVDKIQFATIVPLPWDEAASSSLWFPNEYCLAPVFWILKKYTIYPSKWRRLYENMFIHVGKLLFPYYASIDLIRSRMQSWHGLVFWGTAIRYLESQHWWWPLASPTCFNSWWLCIICSSSVMAFCISPRKSFS